MLSVSRTHGFGTSLGEEAAVLHTKAPNLVDNHHQTHPFTTRNNLIHPLQSYKPHPHHHHHHHRQHHQDEHAQSSEYHQQPSGSDPMSGLVRAGYSVHGVIASGASGIVLLATSPLPHSTHQQHPPLSSLATHHCPATQEINTTEKDNNDEKGDSDGKNGKHLLNSNGKRVGNNLARPSSPLPLPTTHSPVSSRPFKLAGTSDPSADVRLEQHIQHIHPNPVHHPSRTTVAVKAIPTRNFTQSHHDHMRALSLTLATLNHKYIGRLLDACEDQHYHYHVFEYLPGGDLYARLEQRGKPFSEQQALFIVRQVLQAVAYLHEKGFAHRDIKLENIVFMTPPGNKTQLVKLIDFDLLLNTTLPSPTGPASPAQSSFTSPEHDSQNHADKPLMTRSKIGSHIPFAHTGHPRNSVSSVEISRNDLRSNERSGYRDECHANVLTKRTVLAQTSQRSCDYSKLVSGRVSSGTIPSEMCGTILYVSPEIAARMPHVPEQSDMWAVGVLLYTLIAYETPFQASLPDHVLDLILHKDPDFSGAAWRTISPSTVQLIRSLLAKSGSDRPTALGALDKVKHIQSDLRFQQSSSDRSRSTTPMQGLGISWRGLHFNRSRRSEDWIRTNGTEIAMNEDSRDVSNRANLGTRICTNAESSSASGNEAPHRAEVANGIRNAEVSRSWSSRSHTVDCGENSTVNDFEQSSYNGQQRPANELGTVRQNRDECFIARGNEALDQQHARSLPWTRNFCWDPELKTVVSFQSLTADSMVPDRGRHVKEEIPMARASSMNDAVRASSGSFHASYNLIDTLHRGRRDLVRSVSNSPAFRTGIKTSSDSTVPAQTQFSVDSLAVLHARDKDVGMNGNRSRQLPPVLSSFDRVQEQNGRGCSPNAHEEHWSPSLNSPFNVMKPSEDSPYGQSRGFLTGKNRQESPDTRAIVQNDVADSVSATSDYPSSGFLRPSVSVKTVGRLSEMRKRSVAVGRDENSELRRSTNRSPGFTSFRKEFGRFTLASQPQQNDIENETSLPKRIRPISVSHGGTVPQGISHRAVGNGSQCEAMKVAASSICASTGQSSLPASDILPLRPAQSMNSSGRAESTTAIAYACAWGNVEAEGDFANVGEHANRSRTLTNGFGVSDPETDMERKRVNRKMSLSNRDQAYYDSSFHQTLSGHQQQGRRYSSKPWDVRRSVDSLLYNPRPQSRSPPAVPSRQANSNVEGQPTGRSRLSLHFSHVSRYPPTSHRRYFRNIVRFSWKGSERGNDLS